MRTPKIEQTPCGMGGPQKLYQFANGYGASVIQFFGSYGYTDDLWELAVVKYDGDGDYDLTYDTPITSDVIGHLTLDDVESILDRIEAL